MALGFPVGQTPAVATLHRLYRRLDVTELERIVTAWIETTGVATDEPLAIDGQTLRAVATSDVPCSHVLSVYAHNSAAVLARIVVPNKGYEQPAFDRIIQQVPLGGRVVTFDALHTHRDVCQVLDDAGATFLAPVKGNQATLYAEVQDEFAAWPLLAGHPPLWLQAEICQAGGSWEEYVETPTSARHGRLEWRRVCVWSDPRWSRVLGQTSDSSLPWPMVRQLIRVERRRDHVRRKQIIKTETEIVYFLRNHPASAPTVAQQIRAHWRIENRLHRQRDVLLDQDRSTTRLGGAPQILVACRDLVLTLLHRCHVSNAAATRRTWAARPYLAASLVLSL